MREKVSHLVPWLHEGCGWYHVRKADNSADERKYKKAGERPSYITTPDEMPEPFVPWWQICHVCCQVMWIGSRDLEREEEMLVVRKKEGGH